jgi:hypothetical protein
LRKVVMMPFYSQGRSTLQWGGVRREGGFNAWHDREDRGDAGLDTRDRRRRGPGRGDIGDMTGSRHVRHEAGERSEEW